MSSQRYIFIFIGIIYFVMFAWWSIIRPLGSWPGRDLPAEHEILYSEGILRSVDERISRNHTAPTIVIPGTYGLGRYYCSHTPTHRNISCLSDKKMEAYINRPVRVGWYLPKPYLWFDNPYRQVATLEINGETVISYQDTQRYIKNSQRFEYKANIVIAVFCLALSSYLYLYVPFVYIRQKRSLKTKES